MGNLESPGGAGPYVILSCGGQMQPLRRPPRSTHHPRGGRAASAGGPLARPTRIGREKPRTSHDGVVRLRMLFALGARDRTRTCTSKGHWNLNPARLPIPPPSLVMGFRTVSTSATSFKSANLESVTALVSGIPGRAFKFHDRTALCRPLVRVCRARTRPGENHR